MSERRRTLIPLEFRDLDSWPTPSVETMDDEAKNTYNRRRTAIGMYARGVEYAHIRAQTGMHRPEVRRLIHRCLSQASDGSIFGWFGIVKGIRVKTYERTSQVIHERGSGSGGCAGALAQLFGRYPEVQELVDALYFGEATGGAAPTARISIAELHNQFKKALRDRGFSDADWPFNTDNCGYNSLARYCTALELNERERAVLPRGGREAENRHALGNGHSPLFSPIRPYTCVQLDFHKVDAASVFSLTNDHGAPFVVPLARWHFGLIIEEVTGACMGYCVALELTPSADSVLETVQSALSGNDAHVVSGEQSALIYEIVPSLQQQCFSVLKMDNAWSNASTEVVNNIITVMGAAVNFGPVRSWWRRSLIERIFGRLTELGLKRLPSTFGSGPSDTRVDRPQDAAAKFKIDVKVLSDVFRQCIRKHNITVGRRGQWMAPAERLKNALQMPSSGVFRNPLPTHHGRVARLLMHREEVTVRGNAKKNIRPYFVLGQHRHTNIELANRFWLIGKKLLVSVNRRLAREVYAIVADTGEDLGRMVPAGPWSRSECSWRDRVLLQRAGNAVHRRSVDEDPLEIFQQHTESDLAALSSPQKKRASKTALSLAKSMQYKSDSAHNDARPSGSQQEAEKPAPEDARGTEKSTVLASPKKRRDPFGLALVPALRSTWGEE